MFDCLVLDVRGRITANVQRNLSVSPPEWSNVSGSPSSLTPSLSPCQKCRYSVCVDMRVFPCVRVKESLTGKVNKIDVEQD